MRHTAEEIPRWADLKDWSWAARFGYQIVIKRGAGGAFFRSLYSDFLGESAKVIPAIGEAKLPEQMDDIARLWVEFALVLKEQSERETCRPALFEEAGRRLDDLTDREERVFASLLALSERDDLWLR